MKIRPYPADLLRIMILTALLALSGCASMKKPPPVAAKTDESAFQANVTAEGVPVAPPTPAEVATDVDDSREDEGAASPKARKRRKVRYVEVDDENDDEEVVRVKRRAPASVKRPKRGGTMTYVVKEADTLMKISFKVFGDVYRWREIYRDNRSKVNNPTFLTRGTTLTIRGASDFASITRNGFPYLIRWADTLRKISSGIYGTPTQWPRLWHNNPELIHDPNKIYAGFRLYYELTEQEKATLKTRAPASKSSSKPHSAGSGKSKR